MEYVLRRADDPGFRWGRELVVALHDRVLDRLTRTPARGPVGRLLPDPSLRSIVGSGARSLPDRRAGKRMAAPAALE